MKKFVTFVLLLGVAGLLGCGAKTGLGQPDGSAPPITFDAAVPDADLPDAIPDADLPDAIPDADLPDAIPDAEPPCPDAVTVAAREATIPIDIIWAIDSSGSMIDDIGRMHDNVEIFWDALLAADIDAHVIFVTPRGFAPSPPAGFSGRFAAIDYEVRSHNGLTALLTTFADYERHLRPDARTHFVVVTDDESQAMTAETFFDEMTSALGHEFTFHSVASERTTPTEWNPLGACWTDDGLAYAPGVRYYQLSDMTGGLKMSICNEDWSDLFTQMTERIAVPIPLPCSYRVPGPAGVDVDPALIDLVYTPPGGGVAETLPQLGGEGDCGEGWHWFEASERIELCTSTCERLEALGTGGRVAIDIGCVPGALE